MADETPATLASLDSAPDDSEPTLEQQAELRAIYADNIKNDRPPYFRAPITKRGDVLWILQERGWSGEQPDTRQLPRADLRGAYFGVFDLTGLSLVGADLREAMFAIAPNLSKADLRDANFQRVKTLAGAYFQSALLFEADFTHCNLIEANFYGAYLLRANFGHALLKQVSFLEAHMTESKLEDSDLRDAYMAGADLRRASLAGARLTTADLSCADLRGANLQGADFRRATLTGANLQEARMDASTVLSEAKLDATNHLADVVWGSVPLARINWDQVPTVGEATDARKKNVEGTRKTAATRAKEFRDAERASQQLAIALRGQGLSDHADRFAYQARVLRREALSFESRLPGIRVRRRLEKCFSVGWSYFLDGVAGYGYKPLHSLGSYLFCILSFMVFYLLNSRVAAPHLTLEEAFVLSVSSFHGRGFFNSNIMLGDPYALLAANEAICGLLIEVSLIASFTRRFFGD